MIAAEFWWDRFPDRLQAELSALEQAGIEYERDATALRQGVMRLHLKGVRVGDELLDLTVTFPDLYPYFRFEIKENVDLPGETLDLPYHQNPFQKNFCLLGRPTEHWYTHYTVAGLLASKLPAVLRTARATSREDVVGDELQQAEPFSDYYRYVQNSTILIQSEWDLSGAASGALTIGSCQAVRNACQQPLRGVVLQVYDDKGVVLARADDEIQLFGSKAILRGRWVRADEPPRLQEPKELFDYAEAQDPLSTKLKKNSVYQGLTLRIYAIVFPEEAEWRGATRDGWVFVCHLERSRRNKRVNRRRQRR